MNKKMLFAMALAGIRISLAHDLFILPDHFRVAPGATVNFAVHHGDLFPESEQVPPMARLKDGVLYSTQGKTSISNPKADGKRALGSVVVGKGHQILTIQLSENVFPMDAKEFREYLEGEALTNVIEWRNKNGEADKGGRELYSKYAKAIVLAGDGDGGFNRVVGLPLEFIPEADPFQLKAGDMLPVQVLFRGKPAAGVQVITTHVGVKPAPIGKTDAQGKIRVPITATGIWRLHAKVMEKAVVPTADWQSWWATLTFETR